MRNVGILCLLAAATVAFAQEHRSIALGPYVTVKASVNAGSVPQGTDVGVAFTGLPDFGATLFIPFTDRQLLGAALDLGYSVQAVKWVPHDGATADNTMIYKYGYLNIAPMLVASVFTIGPSFGIPVSLSASNVSGSASATGKTSDMSVLVSIQLGVAVPVFENRSGRLNVLGLGSYAITGTDANPVTDVGGTTYNPHPASLAVGVQYLFSLVP